MKYKLGEICEIVSGSTPKTNVEEYWDGDIKWITPAEITDESYIIDDSARKLTELGVKKTGLTPFPAGTVILSSRAPIGKVAIAGCEMYCNQGFKNLICSEKIDNKYLYWFLKGNTAYLNSLGRGATFKEISKGIVGDIEINVPDAAEQEKAVCNLEKLSEIIKLRKKELGELDKLIKARFVEMFGKGLNDDGRFPLYPVSSVGKVISGATPKTTNEDYWDGDNLWITPAELSEDSFIVYDTVRKITDEGVKSCAVNKLPVGTVILSSRAPIGKVAIAGITMYCNQGFKNIIPSEMINSIYLYELLSMETDYLNSLGRGATFKEISKQIVENIKIKVPPIGLQNRFADFVKQVYKSKVAVKKALKETQTLFNGLMQEYFR